MVASCGLLATIMKKKRNVRLEILNMYVFVVKKKNMYVFLFLRKENRIKNWKGREDKHPWPWESMEAWEVGRQKWLSGVERGDTLKVHEITYFAKTDNNY